MDFEGFLPKEAVENDINDFEVNKGNRDFAVKNTEKINQEQFYDMLMEREPSWQAIIYDLIHSEQLDPWDINLIILSQKYLEKIKQLEEENFFVSSKVLLAASLLLRIKSEILLNEYIKSLDEILFGKKEEKKYVMERIEIDESEIPVLFPKTPLPRFKQVTLQELMSALGKAMNTENRRIRREISEKRAEKLSHVDILKTRVNVRDRIRKIYARISTYFKKKSQSKLSYTELAGKGKEERIACFLPILHLSNQQKVWLEQENHFDEIYIWLYELYNKKDEALHELEKEIEEVEHELGNEMDNEQLRRLERINNDFENPLANFFDMTSEIIKGEI